MPSPTCTTVPTSRVSTAAEKFLICWTRMELISSVGAAMASSCTLGGASRGLAERLAQPFESAAHAVVDELVPNSSNAPADDAGIDVRADGDLLRATLQVGGQALGEQ